MMSFQRPPLVPSLMVPLVADAVDFYTRHLGFSQTGSWEDKGELVWAEIRRDQASIWFYRDAMRPGEPPTFTGFLYTFVDNVDEEVERIKPHLTSIWGPEDMEYGRREFGFEDLNGYRFVFAKDI
jgi:catechol 2,3-dioxygenase-like lactoylglutathione lyase family enzyme